MKNIQIIDGAENCTFSIFQATDEEFSLIFPGDRQDIEYNDDISKRRNAREVDMVLNNIWQRPIRKQDAMGIHGTILYGFKNHRLYYSDKREDAVHYQSINGAQRKLFNTKITSPRPVPPGRQAN